MSNHQHTNGIGSIAFVTETTVGSAEAYFTAKESAIKVSGYMLVKECAQVSLRESFLGFPAK